MDGRGEDGQVMNRGGGVGTSSLSGLATPSYLADWLSQDQCIIVQFKNYIPKDCLPI